ncbi:MAG TPA: gliding motility-associated ABC transporter ATP-binding subunit GldA [Chitinophagales bacterium]|nr:gliding motility-associated ABC transporter ATP-binding subunit GldA [Chitinophagales bacterium]
MSIIVSGLTKIYGTQRAVDAISFEVKPGEVLGLLGPNGAGKSTTMKILTGYLPQSEGSASVCGFDVEKQSMEARRHIGYLAENNPLYTDLYVKEFLLFVAALNQVKHKAKRVGEMIQLTGLEREQLKKIGALSKGYRQRVGIAQALLHDPEVLILDEPTSGLDPNQLTEVRQMIRELGKEKTVILSTHIMQEVQAICSRVVIINKGKIVADDSIERLQQRSSGETVILVSFKQETTKSKLKEIRNVMSVETAGENKWKISGSKGLQETIFQFAVANQLTITSLNEEQQSLEEVFKELTH